MKYTATFLLFLLLTASGVRAQAPIDLAVGDAGPVDYVLPGTHTFQIGGKVVSGLLSNLNSFQVGYSFNGGPWHVQDATIPYYQGAGDQFLMTTPVAPSFSVSAPGQYELKIWIKSSTINDPNPLNDTMLRIVRVHQQLPPKNVLFEMLKFQNCTPCYPTDTAVEAQIVPSPYTNVAKLFIAKGEPLFQADACTVDSTMLGLNGHPAFMYDRFRWPFSTDIPVAYNAVRVWNPAAILIDDTGYRVQYLEPASVSFDAVTYDPVQRKLKVRLQATLFDTLKGDYRFNLFLTEDSITTFQSGAPNYYSYVHNHVLRSMAGGLWGKALSLPSTLLPGSSYTYEFQYQVPTNYVVTRMRLIGLMQRYDADMYNRRVLNSCGAPLLKAATITTGIATASTPTAPLILSPNPVKDQLRFSWPSQASQRLQLLTADGRLLREWYDQGKDVTAPASDLPGGSYVLRVTDGSTIAAGRFIKL